MAISFPPSPRIFQTYTYEGVTYSWTNTEWNIISTKDFNYAFNQIQINDINQFDAFNLRNLNFRGINLNIFSADSHTLVFSGQQMTDSVISVTESNNSVVVVKGDNTSTTFTIDAVTGGSYSNGVITFSGSGNVNGVQINGFSSASSFSGGTVTGPTNFTNGLTANTISATTYQNLPTDVFVTGGTYSSGTATFTNNTGGTFSVTGFSTSTGSSFTGGTVSGATNFTGGLTANTISATTYQNLPSNFLITYRRLTSSSTLDSTDLSTVNSGNPLIIEMNVATGNTITVPPNSAVTFTIGSQISISQYGEGQTTIVAGLGVTLRSSGSFLKLVAQYSMATLMKVGTNEWYVVGQLAP